MTTAAQAMFPVVPVVPSDGLSQITPYLVSPSGSCVKENRTYSPTSTYWASKTSSDNQQFG